MLPSSGVPAAAGLRKSNSQRPLLGAYYENTHTNPRLTPVVGCYPAAETEYDYQSCGEGAREYLRSEDYHFDEEGKLL